MRGNLVTYAPTLLRVGSIPAHAGEPPDRRIRYRGREVYPRACGGTVLTCRNRMRNWGLSPRMRGNRHQPDERVRCRGSILAHAGEPSWHRRIHGSRRVYPRACGGTIPDGPDPACGSGLSPRMRGNRSKRRSPSAMRGSIPAHAGEPSQGGRLRWPLRVYPRACGGTAFGTVHPAITMGLSPRMRGNRIQQNARGHYRGSIPAHAGEPRYRAAARRQREVYPRACGGTLLCAGVGNTTVGLSPRMRGNRSGGIPSSRRRGSIPAHAGEPSQCIRRESARWVYPRACGGTSSLRSNIISSAGLSPRMRGNRCCPMASVFSPGSIPAHAGEPFRDAPFSADFRVYPRACGGTYCAVIP